MTALEIGIRLDVPACERPASQDEIPAEREKECFPLDGMDGSRFPVTGRVNRRSDCSPSHLAPTPLSVLELIHAPLDSSSQDPFVGSLLMIVNEMLMTPVTIFIRGHQSSFHAVGLLGSMIARIVFQLGRSLQSYRGYMRGMKEP
jgi:hypothetical protein